MELFLALLAAVFLASCVHSHAHLAAPSTAAAQGSVNKAKTGNSDARAAVKNAQRYNDVSADDARRIDAKAGVLKKYW